MKPRSGSRILVAEQEIAFLPTQISGLGLWLDANQESHADDAVNPTFTNRGDGGAARNFAGIDATFKSAVSPRGTHAMRYGPGLITGHQSTFDFATLSWTEAEIFFCMGGTDSDTNGHHRMGGSGQASFWPFTYSPDTIYSDFFSTTRQNYNTTGIADINGWHVLNEISTGSEWTSIIDGIQQFTTGTNTVGFSGTQIIGSAVGGTGLDGDLAEVIMYDHKLTADERAAVTAYLTSKHITA